ncbi:hypothetical protein COY13_02045 [Candidatus Roizmanbacteria bacterium CG_4_10_14_0_2_um_filter_36_35]|uniref:Uncharacterized protein n=2 Tax=Candidatus Roizmaniibacteriota TaxID=1752723 RepID=A0A2M7BXE1_9BACT|nr:MAG: hypothetical protein COS50_01240 [Candidatus Roizmanbacteria bacterium CG03_land_8_20_14_0_80_35_26]PIZ67995.1 MAG: hypothetical protein COY13_02045 [Candidatus Roizmanbacteria bacterium CG_4_10_14_0_2_um_filter_36_35]
MNQKKLNLKINRFDLFFALYIFCIIVSELMGIKTFIETPFVYLSENYYDYGCYPEWKNNKGQ